MSSRGGPEEGHRNLLSAPDGRRPSKKIASMFRRAFKKREYSKKEKHVGAMQMANLVNNERDKRVPRSEDKRRPPVGNRNTRSSRRKRTEKRGEWGVALDEMESPGSLKTSHNNEPSLSPREKEKKEKESVTSARGGTALESLQLERRVISGTCHV